MRTLRLLCEAKITEAEAKRYEKDGIRLGKVPTFSCVIYSSSRKFYKQIILKPVQVLVIADEPKRAKKYYERGALRQVH